MTVLPAEYSDFPEAKVGSPSTTFVTLGLGDADFEPDADEDAELDDDAEGDSDGEPDAETDSELEVDGDAESIAAGVDESGADAVALEDAVGSGSAVDAAGVAETEALASLVVLLLADCVGEGVAAGLEDTDGSAVIAVATGSAEAELARKGIPKAMTSTLIDPATTETTRLFFDDRIASPYGG